MTTQTELKTQQTITGKYQIKPNIFAACTLSVVANDEAGIQAYLGIKRRGDAHVPLGTKIILRPDSYDRDYRPPLGAFDEFALTVVSVAAGEGDKQLLTCTPVKKERFSERRTQARQQTSFPLAVAKARAEFIAFDGTLAGLSLRYQTRLAVMSLSVEQTYALQVSFKEQDYAFSATVRNVLYNWKTYEHRVGVTLAPLDDTQETVLRLLLDPSYKLSLSQKETINTREGKISKFD